MSLLCQYVQYVSIHITYNQGATPTILSAVVADPEPTLFIYLFLLLSAFLAYLNGWHRLANLQANQFVALASPNIANRQNFHLNQIPHDLYQPTHPVVCKHLYAPYSDSHTETVGRGPWLLQSYYPKSHINISSLQKLFSAAFRLYLKYPLLMSKVGYFRHIILIIFI